MLRVKIAQNMFLFVLLIVASFITATPFSKMESGYVANVPHKWVLHSSDISQEKKTFIIAITQQNTDLLKAYFDQVSDPRSPKYGHYLSTDQITEIVEPTKEALDRLTTWLAGHSIKYSLGRNKDFLTLVDVPVTLAEELFNVKFFQWKHSETGKKHVSALGPYFMPDQLALHVDYVAGVLGFPLEAKFQSASIDTGVSVTPDVLRQRYNVSVTGVPSVANSLAVAEFQDQYYSPADLTKFFQTYVPSSTADTVRKVYGANTASSPGVEASLDIQYIMGVAAGVPTDFYILPGFDFWSGLTAWAEELTGQSQPALVHSVSYGSQGNYPSTSLRTRFDTEMQKLGTRGISIIFASGDSGTGCSWDCIEFEASFPATTPSVTSVGATRFINDVVGPEAAVESFGSGGGSSDFFPIPSYQAEAVAQWNKDGYKPPSHYFNAKGRFTPDVSALGIGFNVIVNGQTQSVGGTSASAPTFSAIIGLLNQHQKQNSKPSLGFLNPWIYQTWSKTWESPEPAFFDVTQGGNQHGCCLHGFKCGKGYDPVSGVGTPNFKVLVENLP